MKEKKSDDRVSNAIAVKELLSQSGFKVLEREWERIKEKAFADLIDETIDKDTILERQKVYILICIWMGMPASIMKKGEIAVDEQKSEKKIKDHPIKEERSFMGLRY